MPFDTWQLGKTGVLVNHFLSVFYGNRCFEGMRENFAHMIRGFLPYSLLNSANLSCSSEVPLPNLRLSGWLSHVITTTW